MIPQVSFDSDTSRYQLPQRLLRRFLWSGITLRPRSIAYDAHWALTGVYPPPCISGASHIPARDPCLVLCNHYTRPGLGAWWLALAITAAVAAQRYPDVDSDIHWVMTAAWTFQESHWRRRFLTPLTYWAFNRAARVYGFVLMPPMPPAPDEVEARAQAVLRTVRLARQAARAGGIVGLAPEGRDSDTPGMLSPPPDGAGDFIALLVEAGLPILPVGVIERVGHLQVAFGECFIPAIPDRRAMRDKAVIQQVMAAIEVLIR